jgi:hypothetical protein
MRLYSKRAKNEAPNSGKLFCRFALPYFRNTTYPLETTLCQATEVISMAPDPRLFSRMRQKRWFADCNHNGGDPEDQLQCGGAT